MNSKHSWQNYGLKHIAGEIGEKCLSNQNESCHTKVCRIKGSSGFEHVFLGEKKNDKVQGFHNWLYFYYMEEKNKVLKTITKVILYIVFFRSITLVTDRKPVLERKQLSFHLVLPGAKKRNLLGKGAPKSNLLNGNST